MGEPEALHPFSSNFRSQLCEVLSKPAMASRIKQIPDDKQFLETEIDLYSDVQIEKPNSAKRPPTPPKPVHRAFVFNKTNPFLKNSSEVNNMSLPKYAEVNKPKNRPKIPPKPLLRSGMAAPSTLPHTQKVPDQNETIPREDCFSRVNSLPNLTPEITNTRPSGNFLLTDSRNQSTPGYGHLSRTRQSIQSCTSAYHMAHDDASYCDIKPDSPTTPQHYSRYENIYEDVNAKTTTAAELKLQTASDSHGSDSDYTLMCSPATETNFTFDSLYENSAMIHSPESDVFHANGIEFGMQNFSMGDPNRVGLPEQGAGSQIPSATLSQISPTSSCGDHDSSAYSVQSSMASTTASSFQRVEICFFPPSPGSYQGSGDVLRPGSATSGSCTSSRSSRSRIPIPIKPKKQDPAKPTMPGVPDQQLSPTPSVVISSKNSKKTDQLSPPGNELVPSAGKSLGTKGARWYEKLGCIKTETIHQSEPYGRPGERKRSKSLNREQRKSQFFLPVEPNASDTPKINQIPTADT